MGDLARRLADARVVAVLGLTVSLGPTAVVRAQTPLDIDKAVIFDAENTTNISTKEVRQALEKGSPLVFDVRPYREYAISHIPGAINVAPKPGTSREEYMSDIAEIGRLVEGNKTAPMILYCAGPHCGKSKRVAAELVEAGYTNVRRYQLGIPVWRALGGVTEIEVEGVQYVAEKDQTAVFIDARDPERFERESLPGARSIPRSRIDPGTFDPQYRAWSHPGGEEVKAAKSDGRLPWRTTTRGSSSSAIPGKRRVKWRKPSQGMRSTTFRSAT